MNTVKRALMTLPFERRAALLLRNLARLRYPEIARALECSPEAASRQLAAARRPVQQRLPRDSPYEVQPARIEQLPG